MARFKQTSRPSSAGGRRIVGRSRGESGRAAAGGGGGQQRPGPAVPRRRRRLRPGKFCAENVKHRCDCRTTFPRRCIDAAVWRLLFWIASAPGPPECRYFFCVVFYSHSPFSHARVSALALLSTPPKNKQIQVRRPSRRSGSTSPRRTSSSGGCRSPGWCGRSNRP